MALDQECWLLVSAWANVYRLHKLQQQPASRSCSCCCSCYYEGPAMPCALTWATPWFEALSFKSSHRYDFVLLCVYAAALLLGAERAVGTDTDPLAVRAAQANAVLNVLSESFTVVKCGANLDDPDPVQQVCRIWYCLDFALMWLFHALYWVLYRTAAWCDCCTGCCLPLHSRCFICSHDEATVLTC